MNEAWSWQFALEIAPQIARGLLITVAATLAGTALGMVLGLVLALLRRSPLKVVSWPTAAVVEFIRSTPLLVQLFFIFYVLPNLGVTLRPFTALVLGLGVHYGTYTSESYRAGIDSVGRGQWEAAVALNLRRVTTWVRVVLPQAIPTVLPALGNYVVAMFKDAPLGAAISVIGVLASARQISSVTFRNLEPFSLVGVMFLVVSVPAAILVRRLEKHYEYRR